MVLADFARCLRPEVRPRKDEERRVPEGLPDRRRHWAEVCAQEKLRPKLRTIMNTRRKNDAPWSSRGLPAKVCPG
jgi:hypothetical protein